MKRIDYLDSAKGILIILMVFGHVFAYGRITDTICLFHMPAFFVISGILLNYTNGCDRDYKSFVLSRLYSFGIPFVIYESIGIVKDILQNGQIMNIKGYIYNTLTMNLNNKNMWFLISLFCIEIMFVGIIKLVKNKNVMLVFGVLFLALAFIIPRLNGYIYQLSYALRNFIYFAAGFCLKDFFVKKNTVAMAVTCFCVAAIGAIFGRNESVGVFTAINAAIAIAGSYGVIQLCICCSCDRVKRILAEIGKNSMVIYGTHNIYYVVIGLLIGVRDYKSTPILQGIIILLAVALIEIPTVYIANRWLPFLAGKHYRKKTMTAG